MLGGKDRIMPLTAKDETCRLEPLDPSILIFVV